MTRHRLPTRSLLRTRSRPRRLAAAGAAAVLLGLPALEAAARKA